MFSVTETCCCCWGTYRWGLLSLILTFLLSYSVVSCFCLLGLHSADAGNANTTDDNSDDSCNKENDNASITVLMIIILPILNFAILSEETCHIFCSRLPPIPSSTTPPQIPHYWLIFIKMHTLTSAPPPSCSSLSLSLSFMPSLPSSSLPLSLPTRSHFSRSVLRGWGRWRMVQVAMTTPGASTARTASTEAASSCVCSSLCPWKTTPAPATCSCFAGENTWSWHFSLIRLFISFFICPFFRWGNLNAMLLPRACYLNNEMLFKGN